MEWTDFRFMIFHILSPKESRCAQTSSNGQKTWTFPLQFSVKAVFLSTMDMERGLAGPPYHPALQGAWRRPLLIQAASPASARYLSRLARRAFLPLLVLIIHCGPTRCTVRRATAEPRVMLCRMASAICSRSAASSVSTSATITTSSVPASSLKTPKATTRPGCTPGTSMARCSQVCGR